MPTMKEMMSSLSETVRDALEKGLVMGVIRSNPEAIQNRLEICTSCDRFEYEPVRRCTVCGCSVSVKIHFAAARCPLDKWGPTV